MKPDKVVKGNYRDHLTPWLPCEFVLKGMEGNVPMPYDHLTEKEQRTARIVTFSIFQMMCHMDEDDAN